MRRILLAYTVNQLGTWFAYVALMLSVYDHTHSALAVAGLLVAVFLVLFGYDVTFETLPGRGHSLAPEMSLLLPELLHRLAHPPRR